MLLHVVHETTYDYAPPVKTAQHVAHLRPSDRDGQRVLSHSLVIDPKPEHCTESSTCSATSAASSACRARTTTCGWWPTAWSPRSRRASPPTACRGRRRASGCATTAGRVRRRGRVPVRLALRAAARGLRRLCPAQLPGRAGRCWRPRASSPRASTPTSPTSRKPPTPARRRWRRWSCARACARTSRT
jgi:hypothetical protein